ncbi:MAG: M55 family metallopeptidase [Propionibacteriales bacterium]|nr:M55 family metallopeptidase [Propionibacteriales bacterium]
MCNLDPAGLPRAASYLSGRHKPAYMMEGLDATFAGVFFVGYHGRSRGRRPCFRTPTTRAPSRGIDLIA